MVFSLMERPAQIVEPDGCFGDRLIELIALACQHVARLDEICGLAAGLILLLGGLTNMRSGARSPFFQARGSQLERLQFPGGGQSAFLQDSETGLDFGQLAASSLEFKPQRVVAG